VCVCVCTSGCPGKEAVKRLTAKNRDQLRNPTLIEYGLPFYLFGVLLLVVCVCVCVVCVAVSGWLSRVTGCAEKVRAVCVVV